MFLCDECSQSTRPHGQRFFKGTVPVGGICSWCNRVGHHQYDDVLSEPVQVSFGPHPTSVGALERHPSIIWDVNGYYRDLGVQPTATRMELRRAYIEKGGPDNPDLTFILKQLLDPEVRLAYDSTPLGQVFFDKQRKAWVVEQRRRRNGNTAPGDEPDDLSEVLDGLVNKVIAMETLDPDAPTVLALPEWPWSMWRWRVYDDVRPKAMAWVEALVVALRAEAYEGRFAIGFWHGPGVQVRRSDGMPILFVGDAVTPEEYPELAAEAALLLRRRSAVLS